MKIWFSFAMRQMENTYHSCCWVELPQENIGSEGILLGHGSAKFRIWWVRGEDEKTWVVFITEIDECTEQLQCLVALPVKPSIFFGFFFVGFFYNGLKIMSFVECDTWSTNILVFVLAEEKYNKCKNFFAWNWFYLFVESLAIPNTNI